jgi:hypothetical protein
MDQEKSTPRIRLDQLFLFVIIKQCISDVSDVYVYVCVCVCVCVLDKRG